MKKQKKEVFIAESGDVFLTEEECIEHEAECSFYSLFIQGRDSGVLDHESIAIVARILVEEKYELFKILVGFWPETFGER